LSFRSLIIDDSPFIIETLRDLLRSDHPHIEVVGIGSNGASGLKLIQAHKPDLVFLDVEMPGMNGFEMLAQLSEIDFQTIFITSFSKYAISAIRFNALDYLLKPIEPDQLEKAIIRFEKSHDSKMNQIRIAQALENFEKDDISEQTFTLATQEGEVNMKLKDIIRLEGDRNYTRIMLHTGKAILSSKNLRFFEERLSDKGFFRCHRSHLVNKTHVESIKADSYLMRGGDQVLISRRKKSEARSWLKGNGRS
jgi:two-component system LytT family response regulator